MSFQDFSELLEELLEAGINPTNDIESTKHYVNEFGTWSDDHYREWVLLNGNREPKPFTLA